MQKSLRNSFQFRKFSFTGRFPERDEPLVGDLTFNVCKKCKLIQLEQAYSLTIYIVNIIIEVQ